MEAVKMVRRNDPCPCGSGKKYKRCCGSSSTNLMDIVVNEELDRVLVNYFDTHPQGPGQEEMQILMRKWMNRLSDSWETEDIEEASSEFYLFIENKKSWQSYLNQQHKVVKREAVLNILEAWVEPILLLGEITKVDEQFLYVDELFGVASFKMVRNEGMPTDEGNLLFGVVLKDPRKGPNVVAPVSSILFLAKWSKQTKKSLAEQREVHLKKENSVFVQEHALDIYELFIKRSMATMNELVEEVLSKEQLTALATIEDVLRELNQTASAREIIHKLAVAYFLNEEPQIERQEDLLAGILQVGISIGVVQGTQLTKEEIIEEYKANSAEVSQYYTALKALYDNMMQSGDEPVAEKVYAIGTDPRLTEKALWETSMTTGGVVLPERKPTVAGGRAQLLAYEAYAADTEEQRRLLADRAYEIDHKNADALLLRAEIEKDVEKANTLYEAAIREASRTFEAGENPWQNIPNRPFMRAAFAYGVHLFECGEFNEAASMFTDLVKMNPIDNQGARYEAIASLIHAGRFNEAAELLVRYEKGSANDATYLYLDWKLEHTASNGESDNAEEMLMAAQQANSHVQHLQTFRVAPIDYPRLQELEPGSKEEARYIYLLIHGEK